MENFSLCQSYFYVGNAIVNCLSHYTLSCLKAVKILSTQTNKYNLKTCVSIGLHFVYVRTT